MPACDLCIDVMHSAVHAWKCPRLAQKVGENKATEHDALQQSCQYCSISHSTGYVEILSFVRTTVYVPGKRSENAPHSRSYQC